MATTEDAAYIKHLKTLEDLVKEGMDASTDIEVLFKKNEVNALLTAIINHENPFRKYVMAYFLEKDSEGKVWAQLKELLRLRKQCEEDKRNKEEEKAQLVKDMANFDKYKEEYETYLNDPATKNIDNLKTLHTKVKEFGDSLNKQPEAYNTLKKKSLTLREKIGKIIELHFQTEKTSLAKSKEDAKEAKRKEEAKARAEAEEAKARAEAEEAKARAEAEAKRQEEEAKAETKRQEEEAKRREAEEAKRNEEEAEAKRIAEENARTAAEAARKEEKEQLLHKLKTIQTDLGKIDVDKLDHNAIATITQHQATISELKKSDFLEKDEELKNEIQEINRLLTQKRNIVLLHSEISTTNQITNIIQRSMEMNGLKTKITKMNDDNIDEPSRDALLKSIETFLLKMDEEQSALTTKILEYQDQVTVAYTNSENIDKLLSSVEELNKEVKPKLGENYDTVEKMLEVLKYEKEIVTIESNYRQKVYIHANAIEKVIQRLKQIDSNITQINNSKYNEIISHIKLFIPILKFQRYILDISERLKTVNSVEETERLRTELTNILTMSTSDEPDAITYNTIITAKQPLYDQPKSDYKQLIKDIDKKVKEFEATKKASDRIANLETDLKTILAKQNTASTESVLEELQTLKKSCSKDELMNLTVCNNILSSIGSLQNILTANKTFQSKLEAFLKEINMPPIDKQKKDLVTFYSTKKKAIEKYIEGVNENLNIDVDTKQSALKKLNDKLSEITKMIETEQSKIKEAADELERQNREKLLREQKEQETFVSALNDLRSEYDKLNENDGLDVMLVKINEMIKTLETDPAYTLNTRYDAKIAEIKNKLLQDLRSRKQDLEPEVERLNIAKNEFKAKYTNDNNTQNFLDILEQQYQSLVKTIGNKLALPDPEFDSIKDDLKIRMALKKEKDVYIKSLTSKLDDVKALNATLETIINDEKKLCDEFQNKLKINNPSPKDVETIRRTFETNATKKREKIKAIATKISQINTELSKQDTKLIESAGEQFRSEVRNIGINIEGAKGKYTKNINFPECPVAKLNKIAADYNRTYKPLGPTDESKFIGRLSQIIRAKPYSGHFKTWLNGILSIPWINDKNERFIKKDSLTNNIEFDYEYLNELASDTDKINQIFNTFELHKKAFDLLQNTNLLPKRSNELKLTNSNRWLLSWMQQLPNTSEGTIQPNVYMDAIFTKLPQGKYDEEKRMFLNFARDPNLYLKKIQKEESYTTENVKQYLSNLIRMLEIVKNYQQVVGTYKPQQRGGTYQPTLSLLTVSSLLFLSIILFALSLHVSDKVKEKCASHDMLRCGLYSFVTFFTTYTITLFILSHAMHLPMDIVLGHLQGLYLLLALLMVLAYFMPFYATKFQAPGAIAVAWITSLFWAIVYH